MKTLIGACANSVVGFYERLPFYVRGPLILGVAVVAVSELNIDVNHSLQSAGLFAGQRSQADANSGDIQKVRADLQSGKPVTGASGLVATTVDQQAAAARQSDATAKNLLATVPQTGALTGAAVESIEDIQQKIRLHQPITSTEQMRLVEYEIKVAERDKARAEAKVSTQLSAMWTETADGSSPYNPVGLFGRLAGQPERPAAPAAAPPVPASWAVPPRPRFAAAPQPWRAPPQPRMVYPTAQRQEPHGINPRLMRRLIEMSSPQHVGERMDLGGLITDLMN